MGSPIALFTMTFLHVSDHAHSDLYVFIRIVQVFELVLCAGVTIVCPHRRQLHEPNTPCSAYFVGAVNSMRAVTLTGWAVGGVLCDQHCRNPIWVDVLM